MRVQARGDKSHSIHAKHATKQWDALWNTMALQRNMFGKRSAYRFAMRLVSVCKWASPSHCLAATH